MTHETEMKTISELSENSELKSKLAKMGIENGILKEGIAMRPEPDDDNGMTTREYYSGIILQGLLSTTTWSTASRPSILAKNAVRIADALITELAKTIDIKNDA